MSNFKCYSCGKSFKDNAHLQAHKNRKTPCLIREVPPEQIQNPNRCIFCNKILSKKENLTRHLKICKIKNGGMNILDDKVRHEQEIRILKDRVQQQTEQMQQQTEQMQQQKEHLQQQLNQVVEMNKQLRERMDQMEKPVVQNNIINNQIGNQVINQTINFYNYDNPKVDQLKLTQDDLIVENVTKKLIEMIFFNKNIPENHVLYRPNIKEQRLLVHKNGTWKNIAGEELSPVFTSVKNTAFNAGNEKINGGGLYQTDHDFMALYPVVREAIRRFNIGEQITDGAIMDIITENREMIKQSLGSVI